MKSIHLTKSLSVALLVLESLMTASGQGTVTFDQPGVGQNVVHYLWFYNDPIGMAFGISPQVPDNYLERLTQVSGHPSSGSPHLEHRRFGTIQSLATINHTSALPFGLVSVDLADPAAPSLTPIDITFNGFRADDSMVSQTFVVGGGGSTTFQTFYFSPDFAHGLVRVEIPSPAWAMDNLVWIPEPSSGNMLLLGILMLVARRRRTRYSVP